MSDQPACPACGSLHAGHPLVRYSAPQAAQHFVLAEEFPTQHRALQDKIRALWHGDSIAMLQCEACELKFSWPFIAGDGDFYNLAYPYSSYPKERWEFDRTLEALQEPRLADATVLEIGSGFGYFLRKISPRFVPPSQVLAIEYNDTARAKLQEAGFTAIAQDVRTPAFDLWRGKIGAFFMFQVLEHMDALDLLFSRLAELARPNADLFIAVPNLQRIEFSERHGSLRDMPPNHISQWTPQSFQALARRFGLQWVTCSIEPTTLSQFIKVDLVQSHMQRAQRPDSVANRVRSRPRNGVRMALEAAAALLAAPSRLVAWRAAARQPHVMSDSLWVHLRFGSHA